MRASQSRYAAVVVLAVLFVAGLYLVKWSPYYHRAYTAAAQHSIGPSLLGQAASPPPPSVASALGYAWAYGTAIWQAMALGLVIGAGIQAVVPRDWLCRVFGSMRFGAVALAGLASVPSMM